MKRLSRALWPMGASLAILGAAGLCPAEELVSQDAAAGIGLRPYWSLQLPVDAGLVDRMIPVDDNLYAITSENYAMAIHADTGVLRWMSQVSKPGNRVLGPTHTKEMALFTSQMGVQLFHRQTGKPYVEMRSVRGVLIETDHDIATINLGRVHGLELGTRLTVHERERGDRAGRKLADLEIVVVREREARGRLTRLSPTDHPESGAIILGRFGVPLRVVELPFAPSSPAIGDDTFIYYGGSNKRLYKLRMLDGIRQWEVATDGPISTMPRLEGDAVFIAAQDGRVSKIRAKDRHIEWSFQTEGAIFGEPSVTPSGIYVSSSDRSLYALDPKDGHKRWRRPFGSIDLSAPFVAAESLFVHAPGEGFFALDAADGAIRWKLTEAARLLTVDDGTVYVLHETTPGGSKAINSYDVLSGRRTGELPLVFGAEHVCATPAPLTLIVGDTLGHVQCLRSTRYPHLKPEQLAAVLLTDAQAGIVDEAAMKGAAGSQPSMKQPGMAAPDDPFKSTSRVRPVGGHGLTDVPDGAPPAASAPAKAAKNAKEADSSEAGEGEEDASDEEAADSEESDKAEKPAPSDSKNDVENDDSDAGKSEDVDTSDTSDDSSGSDDDKNTSG